MARKRSLPAWLKSTSDQPQASHEVRQASPDGVFNYASTVLNDGLLLMEFRDAIHKGDGDRILRCWKFMLLHFFASGHSKYALEAYYLLSHVHAVAPPRLAHQITWSRTVNTRGKQGHNIPIDLQMEHLNRSLKDSILGLGANITESIVVENSQSLKGVMDVSSNFDHICGVTPDSIHHTTKSSIKDRDMILEELSSKSRVFDYVPGRSHYSKSFKTVVPNIADSLDAGKLFEWFHVTYSCLEKVLYNKNLCIYPL